MPDTCTDLVIQISATVPAEDVSGEHPEAADASCVVAELQRWLKPGTEIGLVVRGCMAITSILWLSGPTADRCLRAGVRFVGVSALPSSHPEPAAPLVESPPTVIPA